MKTKNLQHIGTDFEDGCRPVTAKELIQLRRTNPEFSKFSKQVMKQEDGRRAYPAFLHVEKSNNRIARMHEQEEQAARIQEARRKRSEEMARYATE